MPLEILTHSEARVIVPEGAAIHVFTAAGLIVTQQYLPFGKQFQIAETHITEFEGKLRTFYEVPGFEQESWVLANDTELMGGLY